jgi:hypothetical protein
LKEENRKFKLRLSKPNQDDEQTGNLRTIIQSAELPFQIVLFSFQKILIKGVTYSAEVIEKETIKELTVRQIDQITQINQNQTTQFVHNLN